MREKLDWQQLAGVEEKMLTGLTLQLEFEINQMFYFYFCFGVTNERSREKNIFCLCPFLKENIYLTHLNTFIIHLIFTRKLTTPLV